MQLFVAFALLAASITDVTQLPMQPPASLQAFFAKQSPAAKQSLLKEMGQHGIALKMSDEQISALYIGVGSDNLLKATSLFLSENPTYETVLLKQERIKGKVNAVPDRMLIRFREKPLAIYIKWLDKGRHVGQEVIYDSSKDPKALKAHGGGWLNLITVNLTLDSGIVHAETRHYLTELGFGTLIAHLKSDRALLAKNGLSTAPVIERSVMHKGKRYWENVFETPGPPVYYAARARFLFDLETGVPMLTEIFDHQGQLQERMEYESVKWIKLDDKTFEPANPEYRF